MARMLIGLVADNHRLVDQRLSALLSGVDEIFHAGDLVNTEILVALRETAPVVAVRGNNDTGPDVALLPEQRVMVRDGVTILLRHIIGNPERLFPEAAVEIQKIRPTVVVFGHSHRPLVQRHGDVVFVNPGSCGPRRFRLPRAMGLMSLNRATVRARIVDLESLTPIIDKTFRLLQRRSEDDRLGVGGKGTYPRLSLGAFGKLRLRG